MSKSEANEQYSEKEAAARFQAMLKGALQRQRPGTERAQTEAVGMHTSRPVESIGAGGRPALPSEK
jgi:hypothetical protein